MMSNRFAKWFSGLFLFMALLLIAVSGCYLPGVEEIPEEVSGADVSPSVSCTAFQEATLAEINFLRTNPAQYAEERLLAEYNAGCDNGAYLDLKNNYSPRTALVLNPKLCQAASNYAAYLADHNLFGHYENGSPGDRCTAAGYSNYSGENLAANTTLNGESHPESAARAFVEQLVIDQGVASLGHRKNLLGTSHKAVGIGFARNSAATYDNYTVQDFGSAE